MCNANLVTDNTLPLGYMRLLRAKTLNFGEKSGKYTKIAIFSKYGVTEALELHQMVYKPVMQVKQCR